MNFQEYEREVLSVSKDYAIFGTDKALPTYILGLAGEVGETCELIKRTFRGDVNGNSLDFKSALIKELGDALAYVTLVAYCHNISLDELTLSNVEKMKERQKNGILLGKGSER